MAVKKRKKKPPKKPKIVKPVSPLALAKAAKAREARLKRIFNTCSEEYEKVLVYQNGNCAITKKPATQLYLDHNHSTGLLRGLLSYKVNKGLAYFSDDPDLLRNAADYLENPPYSAAVGEDVYGVMGRVTTKPKNRKYGPMGTKLPQKRKKFTQVLTDTTNVRSK
jgi:hypothetical protein